jgi:hypothetical protein
LDWKTINHYSENAQTVAARYESGVCSQSNGTSLHTPKKGDDFEQRTGLDQAHVLAVKHQFVRFDVPVGKSPLLECAQGL